MLAAIKEEATLQSLLHKRILQKERVLSLEHRNGRLLWVILPPDSAAAKAFVEEAKRSKWMQEMLHSEVQQQGVLMCLAQQHPATCVSIGNEKKLLLQAAVLTTPQTVALGRLTGLNNSQMEKLRSFLRTVGKCELKHCKSEILRMDNDVGLHESTPQPQFDKCTLEWATVPGKGNDKKPPESCNCWNTNALAEVASEMEMVLTCRLL